MSVTPRIWVGDLAAYNAGHVRGTGWIDATDEDYVEAAIAEMLRKSPCPNVQIECPECEGKGCALCVDGKVPSAEEWMISDYEGFGPYRVGENSSISEVCRAGALIQEHGIPAALALSLVNDNIDEAVELLESYRGVYDSKKDFAEEWGQEMEHEALEAMPDHLRYCIDWEIYARDNLDIKAILMDDELHIFC